MVHCVSHHHVVIVMKKMKFFGIKNIVYTESINDDSMNVNIVKCPIDQYKTSVVTTGQKWFTNTLDIQIKKIKPERLTKNHNT